MAGEVAGDQVLYYDATVTVDSFNEEGGNCVRGISVEATELAGGIGGFFLG